MRIAIIVNHVANYTRPLFEGLAAPREPTLDIERTRGCLPKRQSGRWARSSPAEGLHVHGPWLVTPST